jgi:DNA-binding NarL/FixJ family response regulator
LKHRARVLVADDRPISLRGLTLILAETEDLTPAATSSSEQLFDVLRAQRFDLLLINLTFSSAGSDILRAIRKEFPDLPTLVLDDDADDLMALRVLRAGAAGYVHAAAATEELLAAIRALLGGKTYLSIVIAEKIARERNRMRSSPAESSRCSGCSLPASSSARSPAP